jgi:hypothetical protein
LDGLHYLQTYERLLIRGIVTAAYTGWAAYASLYIFRPLDYSHSNVSHWSLYAATAVAGVTLIGFWALFMIQSSPWTFYVYIAFPCYFWRQFLVQTIPALQGRRDFKNPISYAGIISKAILVVAVLQGMVVCFLPFRYCASQIYIPPGCLHLSLYMGCWFRFDRCRLAPHMVQWSSAEPLEIRRQLESSMSYHWHIPVAFC